MKTLQHLMLTNFLLASLLVALPMPVLADDLLDIFNIAKERDPQLRAAAANRKADFEAKPQSIAALLPNINASADTEDNHSQVTNSGFRPNADEKYNSNGYSITLTQPLYHHDLWVALRQADSTTLRAEADYQSARQDLIIRVSQAYFDVLAAIDDLSFARAEREATGRQLDDAKQRFDVGLVAITDVYEAQARYDLTVAQVITAENNLANAREALQEITGQYHDNLKVLIKNVPLLTPDPNKIDDWVTEADEKNLQLVSARRTGDIAKEEINRQRAGHYPTLDLVAQRNHSVSNSRFGSTSDLDSIGLQLQVPIFAGGGVLSRTREARYRFQAATETLEQTRRSVIRQTRNAYLGVLAGISRVKALKQAVLSNQKALESSQAGLEVGTRTIVDVLLAQRELFRARADYARSRYDYILNTLKLKQAAGSLSVKDLQGINAWLVARSKTDDK